MQIIKRDGRKQKFNSDKIINAIQSAFEQVDGEITKFAIDKAKEISKYVESLDKKLSVEEIQDIVENKLMASSRKDVAKAYILYRQERTLARENTIDKVVDGIVNQTDDYWMNENSNKDATLAVTMRDYVAGAVSTDKSKRFYLPKDVVEAHNQGIIHFHDMDYFMQPIYNCCLINLEDMLQNGTVISGTKIDKPHKFSTACTIATQAIAQVASSQYGGQSISLSHLSPFVEESRKTFRKKHPSFTKKQIEELVQEDIDSGVQTIQYQVITLMTTNGQAPFITVFMDINEAEEGQPREDLALVIKEVLKQRIRGVKNEKGVYITPAFPKLIYALDENNIHEDSQYYYLTELAAKCTAKRMTPDYISNKVQRQLKNGDTYTCMGCRSFLTPDRFSEKVGNISKALNWKDGKHKYYGRFNQGVVTINLVDVACSAVIESEKNDTDKYDEFWKIFEERLELCHRALRCRHERLLGTKSDVAPILWQYGAIARLDKGEKIDELLRHGYSTISLGYAGLYECVLEMTGYSHTDGHAHQFALDIMQKMNDKCNEWKAAEDIDYSPYGTPLESTTYKFATKLEERFGKIPNVTDRGYVTNSYHVNVREQIGAFEKLKFESEFQALSGGGAISYVEVPDLNNNLDAVLSIMKFIYDNIMYAELNTKSDYCMCCGYDGEIKIETDANGKLYWKCPNCGNTDQKKMSVARRTCGYIGTQYWNQGRTEEIKDRVLHVAVPQCK
jgi:ribonucleoside-triphosphate reductase